MQTTTLQQETFGKEQIGVHEMNYVIIDLEWNQCPEGKEKEEKMLPFEIIEIGAVKVNQEREIIDEFHEIIKPAVYTVLNKKTKEIVPVEMKELRHGRAFPQVIREFFKWCGKEYRFATWGPVDLVELQRNMKYYDIQVFHKPFVYYDVQKLFALIYENNKTPRTLLYAVDQLQLEHSETFHRALSDARYTAKIFQKLDTKTVAKYFSVDYFWNPKSKKEEIYLQFDGYSKYISMEFATKEQLMADKDVRSYICFQCGKRAAKKINWFSNNSKNYYGLFFCREHGYLKGKIRMKKSITNKYFAVKTIKGITREEAEALRNKNKKVHEKKNRRLENKFFKE